MGVRNALRTAPAFQWLIYILLATALLSTGITALGAPSPRKGPYLLYTGDETAMMVLWQLAESATCSLHWGFDMSYSVGAIESNEVGEDHQHKWLIQDLVPGARYYYEVQVEDARYAGSFFAAPSSDADAVKFLAYGDTRTFIDDHEQVCQGIVSTITADPGYQTFLLHVGDWVANGDAEEDWQRQYFSRSSENLLALQASVPIQGCMGNHEDEGLLFEKYWPYPFVEDRYWSFDYGPVHVVVVDQYAYYRLSSEQVAWIDEDLAKTTKTWKFVVLHEPGWSAGGKHSNNTDVQRQLQPLLERHGVAIVFGGHNHYYARCEVGGVVHITTGAGGAPLRSPDLRFPNVITAIEALEFCKIDIAGERLDFEAVTPDGVVIDRFTLVLSD